MAKQIPDPAHQPVAVESRPRCGIVMPISGCDGCTEQHWSDVKAIISDAVDSVGFSPNLVSDADEVGIIQKRIIQNLYENPVVVCDVSGKNPNVMFELGMRLAFDKPTIIIKDDKTTYSFDTAPIEHLEYPRDLRFTRIVDFKRSLGEKVKATRDRAQSDPSYTTFLKHFGTFSVAMLETREVSKEEFILEEIKELRRLFERRDRDMQTILEDNLKFRALGRHETSRRRKLMSIIEPKVLGMIAGNRAEKSPVAVEEIAFRAFKECVSDPEVRNLISSPKDVEEIVFDVLSRAGLS